MKAIIEHLIVAVIAVGMALFGYWLINVYHGGPQRFIDLYDVGWTVWSSTVSVVTWLILYRNCRMIHWLAMPIMGLLSPFIGSILFFPMTPFAWVVIGKFAVVVFPVAVLTGLVISIATLHFRPDYLR
jgi:hypothetical protein